MQIDPNATQCFWEWEVGDWHNSVRYAPGDIETTGEFTWAEELDPDKDERGNGGHTESTQPLADFLHNGPHQNPPLPIVEAILAHFQANKPAWLDPYRLQKAVVARDLKAVEAMLTQGVPADTPVRSLTPFWNAVSLRELAIAETLFGAGVDVNRHFVGTDETILMTLAMFAPDASWESLAQRIVAQGAELEARNCFGETPLMIAAAAGRRCPGLVGILLQAGANVNARSQHGYTPLRNSISCRDAPLSIVRQLVAAGADVNAQDNQGWSVLMEAISSQQVEAVPFLLAAGADVHAISAPTRKNEAPKSVLQFALDYANPKIIQQVRAAL